jgi:hypothetical protein
MFGSFDGFRQGRPKRKTVRGTWSPTMERRAKGEDAKQICLIKRPAICGCVVISIDCRHPCVTTSFLRVLAEIERQLDADK